MLQFLTVDLAPIPSVSAPLIVCDPPLTGMDAGGAGLIPDVPGCRKLTGLDPAQVAQVRA